MQFFHPGKSVSKLKKLIVLWLPALSWMGLIFFLSSRPGLRVAEGDADLVSRKFAHIGEYAILFLLLRRALKGSFFWSENAVLAVAASLSLVYAATDELHQSFVPLREGRAADILFDFLGIVLGLLVARFRVCGGWILGRTRSLRKQRS